MHQFLQDGIARCSYWAMICPKDDYISDYLIGNSATVHNINGTVLRSNAMVLHGPTTWQCS
jgi:hypothetical protein